MRVNLISDLHLEFGDLVLPGGDVLILGGDIVEAKHLTQSKYVRFFNEECSKYREVIYVMGNHEHYGFKFDNTYQQLADNLPGNIHLLENETYELDGVVFIGATLWTDLNKGDPITSYTLKSAMNDYRVITKHYKDKNIYHKLTPEVTREEHMKTKQFISSAVAAAGDKKIILILYEKSNSTSITNLI